MTTTSEQTSLSDLQQRYVAVCREVAKNPKTSWVLFSNGTIIFRAEPKLGTDLVADATSVMKEYGPVMAGCSAGDFNVVDLDNKGEPRRKGWVVASHHPDMLTMVLPSEVDTEESLTVGLYGRSKRDADSSDLTVIHVEDKRAQPTE